MADLVKQELDATRNEFSLAAISWRSVDAYEKLASEYYSGERHPTCANFDVLQDSLLPDLRSLTEGTVANWLEVGCGRGRLDSLIPEDRTILSDISTSMLSLARQRTNDRIPCRLMDAFELPLPEESLGGIVAFLADPYNHAAFFRQARRTLRSGGCLAFTLPNHEWATTVRTALGLPLAETQFIHRDEVICRVPSQTRSTEEQLRLLSDLGFRVASAYTCSLTRRPGTVPSHHVALAARMLGCAPCDVPLLDVYVCYKQD